MYLSLDIINVPAQEKDLRKKFNYPVQPGKCIIIPFSFYPPFCVVEKIDKDIEVLLLQEVTQILFWE